MIKITLPFPLSVNSAYGQHAGRQRFKSKKYKNWLADCTILEPLNIDYAVRITYNFYFPDKRVRDLGNYEKVVTDYLVNQGVLKDDNWQIIQEIVLKSNGVNKENHRVEIEIDKIEDK